MDLLPSGLFSDIDLLIKEFVMKIFSATSIFIVSLFFIAFFFRVYFISQNLFFGPEQGRDFLVIKNIVINHDLTLIGAKTDIDGIFHGPIYYYLATFPFLLSNGSPIFVSLFFIAINSLTVFLIYSLGREMFNKRVGIFSAIMFTFSFGAIVYARWLSNPPLSIPLSALYFLFLYRFLKGHSLSLIWASIVFFLLGEVELLNFIFCGMITLLIIIFYNNEFRKQKLSNLIISFLILIIGSLGNYILFDLRHNFLIGKNLLKLVSGGSGHYISYSESITSNLLGLNSSFSSFVIPFHLTSSFFVLIFGITLLIRHLKGNKKSATVLLLWLLVPLIALIILKHSVLEHFFVFVGVGTILTTALIIDSIWKRKKIFGIALLLSIIGLNLYTWKISIPANINIFFQSTQPELRFSDQLKVIDKIYDRINGKSFSFQSYTIPYWSQDGWKYLFWYYGKQRYGYEPISINEKTLFVIIQDDPSNRNFQKNWLNDTVSKWGKLNNEFRYGVLSVRELII